MIRKRLFTPIAWRHSFGYADSKDAMRCLNCGGKGRVSFPEESVETDILPYRHPQTAKKKYRIITKYMGSPFEDE